MGYFGERLMQLLPQVYRLADDGDLHDFLGVFAPTLDWLRVKVDDFPVLWDIDHAPAEFLPFLGALVGYPYDYTRDPEAQRRDITFRTEFYRRKGVRHSLERILAEQGVTAPVIENEPWEGVTKIPVHEPALWAARFIQELVPAGTKCVFYCRRVALATMPEPLGIPMARMLIFVARASMPVTTPLRIAASIRCMASSLAQGFCSMSIIPS